MQLESIFYSRGWQTVVRNLFLHGSRAKNGVYLFKECKRKEGKKNMEERKAATAMQIVCGSKA